MPVKCVKVHLLQELLICPCVEIHLASSNTCILYHASDDQIPDKLSDSITVQLLSLIQSKCQYLLFSQYLLRKINKKHLVLSNAGFIYEWTAHRQTGFIQIDYKVQGNSFSRTETKQRALLLLILEKNTHSLC